MGLARGRVWLVALLVGVWVMLGAAGSALATVPDITPAPELTSLAHTAKTLLNSHLTPNFNGKIEIGWWKDPPAGANLRTDPFSSDPSKGCQIAVDHAFFDSLAGQGTDGQLEAIVHETFHCYEFALEGEPADVEISHAADMQWLQEGLARWVDMQLFSSGPLPLSIASLKTYFSSSTTSLFRRAYDAVGFWGHLQDVTGDLWSRIPSILRHASSGSQAAVDAALSGLDQEHFFDTWGSSAANDRTGGIAWTASSPDPNAGFAAPLHTITPAGPDSPVSLKLDPYSTDQLLLTVPNPPPGFTETLHIILGSAYGRFGVLANYTTPELKTLTFRGASNSSTLLKPPSCGPGDILVPPPPLTPMPGDPTLAVGDV
jgi:hypothetical protein